MEIENEVGLLKIFGDIFELKNLVFKNCVW